MRKVYWLCTLVSMAVALGLLCLPTFRWLCDEWFRRGGRFYFHGLLIVLISFFLVLCKHQVFAGAKPWLKGILAVLLTLVLGIVVLFQKLPLLYTYSLSAYSLILLTMGVLLVVSGKGVICQLLFPVLFLGLAIPLPSSNQIASFLAKIVATGSVALAEAVGLAVVKEGTLVAVSGYSYSIDPPCSSLNMMLALFTLVLPILYLKRYSRVKTVLFLLATPMVALVFKILLVTSIFWMIQNRGQEAAIVAYHGWAGMLAFEFSLLAIMVPLFLLARREPRQA